MVLHRKVDSKTLGGNLVTAICEKDECNVFASDLRIFVWSKLTSVEDIWTQAHHIVIHWSLSYSRCK